jgi:diguanylate cyclase (GGDEF)-like protein
VAERTAALEQANLQLLRSADLDALTGLLNRRGLHRRIEQDWSQWPQRQLLVIADIDHFKQFNDQYGHHVGDEVLQECARRLSALLGPNDLLARWGGEEFLWLLRGDTLPALQQRAGRMQQGIGQTAMQLSAGPLQVTLTAGAIAADNQSFADCLQQADALLYQGKANGRNRLVLADLPSEPAAKPID